ncbi:MAG: ABC transporter permease [Candidatus Aminicenantes bacterium]|nr:ABC transporter permease [Candidatus Aminicenantes bacterium]
MLRLKSHSFINLIGFAVGITSSILLFLWVRDELSYDRYHEKADQIYRVTYQYEADGIIKNSASTPAPLGPALAAAFPEVKKAVRFGENGFLVSVKDKCFFEQIFFADPDVFELFTFPMVQGNPETALITPYSIIISEDMKKKYFGKEEPVGKIINLNGTGDYKVTGVFKNIPPNSHLRFDFLGSFLDYAGKNSNQWGISNYYTYLLITKNNPQPEFNAKLPQFVEKYRGKDAVSLYKTSYPLQPISRIHLYSNLGNEIGPNGDIRTVYLYSAIALFILLIACLNYINLTTARYLKRTRTVGLLKVVGAVPSQLIYQFLCEAFLFSFLALPFAVLLGKLFLPLFNFLSGKQLEMNLFSDPFLPTLLLGISLLAGFVSGIFPAVFISYLQPIKALKGTLKPNSKISRLRKILVIFQFTLSIVFIISSLIMLNQLNYLKNKDLGFEKKNIVNIPIYRKTALEKYETIKNEFLTDSNVKAVSASSFFQGKNRFYMNYWREGLMPGKNPMINCIIVDCNFLETFSLTLLQGRSFSEKFPGDIEGAYILNESAVNECGWDSPLGKKFRPGNGKEGPVIGVVKDFHFKSFHHEINPLFLYFAPKWFAYFSVRIAPVNIPHTLDFLKNKWRELVPDQTFEYTFLDEDIDNLYRTEARLGKLFVVVTSLSIFIACLGLFGLAAFTVEQRTKEIGIRKALGASAAGIVLLLSKEFTRWVMIANIIAWPIGWYIMNRWLQNFAYRVGIGVWVFMLSGLIILLTTFLTLSYKAIRAATANPIEALKYE